MSQRTVYVATSNAGKLRDFSVAAAAAGAHWQIAPLPGLDALPAPAEDGATFAENARTKALAYGAHAPGAVVVADDSGLEVDALDGAPGLYSARYAERAGFRGPGVGGLTTTDAVNMAALLAALSGVEKRTARYRCILAAARDGEIIAQADGTVDGVLLAGPRGTGGFGYDPLFLVPAYGRTMAELDPEIRLALSHRGSALRLLLSQSFAWE